MGYADLLVGLVTYPDATPTEAIRNSVALAKRLGGKVTALAVEVDIPTVHNRLANLLIGLNDLAREAEARSASQARQCVEAFTAAAKDAGLTADARVERAPLYEQGERICEHARTRDVCLLPIGPAVLADRSIAESVLFGSGRPVIIFSEEAPLETATSFDTIAIAWDGGPRAARAVADALTLLKQARQVQILVITDEKPATKSGAAQDLVRHLLAHGVSSVVREVAADGEAIGPVLARHVAVERIDLLVMGAFGHTRAREFVLGGATSSMLEGPPCPVLMSH